MKIGDLRSGADVMRWRWIVWHGVAMIHTGMTVDSDGEKNILKTWQVRDDRPIETWCVN